MADLARQRLSPEEIVARKQVLLAAFPRPTPAPQAEAPAIASIRRDPASLSEPERLLAEFSGAMSEANRAGGSPEQIVSRKAELLRLNADTLKWARAAANAAKTPAPATEPKPLGELSLRQQLAAMIAGIWRQEASPEQRIARLAKFQSDNAEAIQAVKRNPDEPAAPITK